MQGFFPLLALNPPFHETFLVLSTKKSVFFQINSIFPNFLRQLSGRSGTSSDHDPRPGKCGLNNLGNTCYFNSGIQCIMHSLPFSRYLLDRKWKNYTNDSNPLSMKGELVKAFARLNCRMWQGIEDPLNPTHLKQITNNYAPQFQGYSQHDPHELILFMLDGIHEDLNQFDKPEDSKQEVKTVIGDGTDDSLTAQKAWDNYKLRNKSIIVDTFHGQIKSRCICPNCNATTVVFDPYVSISLPISSPHIKIQEILFIPYDCTKQHQWIEITVSRSPSIDDYEMRVGEMMNCDVFICFASASYFNDFNIIWEPDSFSRNFVILAYEVPDMDKTYFLSKIKVNMFSNSSGLDLKPIFFPILVELPDTQQASSQDFTDATLERIRYLWEEEIYQEEITDNDFSSSFRHFSMHSSYGGKRPSMAGKKPYQPPNKEEEEKKEEQEKNSTNTLKHHPRHRKQCSRKKNHHSLNKNHLNSNFDNENEETDNDQNDPHDSPEPQLISFFSEEEAEGKIVNEEEESKEYEEDEEESEKEENFTNESKSNEEHVPSDSEQSNHEENENPITISFSPESDEEHVPEKKERKMGVDPLPPIPEISIEEEINRIIPSTANSSDESDDSDNHLPPMRYFSPPHFQNDSSSFPSLSTTYTPSPFIHPKQHKYDSDSHNEKLTDAQIQCKNMLILSPIDCQDDNNILKPIEYIKLYDQRPTTRYNNLLDHVYSFGLNGSFLDVEKHRFNLPLFLLNVEQDTFKREKLKHHDKVKLSTCFDFFTEEEKLDPNNQWHCPHCGEFVCARKKMDIWSVPKCLILHLKRFEVTKLFNTCIFTKDERKVDYPDILDIEPYLCGPKTGNTKYKLYAVSEHFGSIEGGHCTAYATVPSNDGKREWYSFNDSCCREASSNEAHTKEAYVLFYERIDGPKDDEIPIVKNPDDISDEEPQFCTL